MTIQVPISFAAEESTPADDVLMSEEGYEEPAPEDPAAEDPAAEEPAPAAAAGVITAFLPLQQTEFYFEGEPTEEEVLAAFPQSLVVVLDGGEVSQIPVSWEVLEDFDQTSFYFYSVRPVWPEEYVLAENLDPMTDVPWITIYREPSAEEISMGESQPELPAEDPGSLSPVFTEAEGPQEPVLQQSEPVSMKDILGLLTEESYAVSSSDVSKIYNYLTKKLGLNKAAACGVMTNLYAESGMLSNNLENTYNIKYKLSDYEYTKRVNRGKKHNGKYTSGYGSTRYFTTDYCGYGLCQWTSLGRRSSLLKTAVKKDVSIANMKMQLGFMKSEMQSGYPQVWATLRGVPNNAKGAYLAAAHFCYSFEVPANTTNTAASRARTALSTYWKSYSGRSDSASGRSFLGLCGYTYPENVKKGIGVTVSGHIISNYRIKKITAKIVTSSGKTKYSKTLYPNTTIYSLYNFDKYILFSKLSSGTYRYLITATDSHGRTVTSNHEFKVSSKSPLVQRGCATKNVRTSLQ